MFDRLGLTIGDVGIGEVDGVLGLYSSIEVSIGFYVVTMGEVVGRGIDRECVGLAGVNSSINVSNWLKSKDH